MLSPPSPGRGWMRVSVTNQYYHRVKLPIHLLPPHLSSFQVLKLSLSWFFYIGHKPWHCLLLKRVGRMDDDDDEQSLAAPKCFDCYNLWKASRDSGQIALILSGDLNLIFLDGNPVEYLAGFEVVFLQPGQWQVLVFNVTALQFALPDRNGIIILDKLKDRVRVRIRVDARVIGRLQTWRVSRYCDKFRWKGTYRNCQGKARVRFRVRVWNMVIALKLGLEVNYLSLQMEAFAYVVLAFISALLCIAILLPGIWSF